MPRTNTASTSARRLRVEGDPRSHPVWRDETAALIATQRLVKLARETGKRIHVLHISTKEEIEFLRDHKDVASVRGDAASPHAGRARMLRAARHPRADESAGARSADHRDGIWRGIEQGIVDVLGSDHAPHTLEEKAQDLSGVAIGHDRRADAGAADARSRQCRPAVAGALRRSHQRRPARLFNIACKGRIAAGYDADFTVVDLKRSETITNKWVASRAGWTPYDGVRVTGWPVGTFVRGRRVMWQGELATPSTGRAGAVPGDAEGLDDSS